MCNGAGVREVGLDEGTLESRHFHAFGLSHPWHDDVEVRVYTEFCHAPESKNNEKKS